MSSPAPRPAASIQNAGFIMVLLLTIIGGDYYVLMHGPELAEARRVQLVQAAEAPAESLTPRQRLSATTARIAERQRQARIAKAAAAAGPVIGEGAASGAVGLAHSTDQALAKTKSGTDALAQAGSSIGSKLLVKAARFYGPAGVYLRALLLLAGLVLVFIQKAPEAKPGQAKRKPIDPKVLRIVAAFCGVLFLAAGYALLNMHHYTPGFIEYGYPGAAIAVLGSGGLVGLLWATTKKPAFGLSTERRKEERPDAVYFPTADGGWITIANPFRGTMVLGGAGAGKTYSIGEPLIEQFAYKNFAGLVYDFKFPVLAEAMQKALVLAERRKERESKQADSYADSFQGKLQARLTALLTKPAPQPEDEPPVQLHIINFRDLTRSERVNPLRPADMPVVAFAEEYSKAIINNLNPSSIRKMEFFDTSSVAYLTGIIWFYKKHYPQYCTIPHVVATAMYKDYTHVLSMLETDLECGDQARSLISAVQTKADKQVGAVLGTLQVNLTKINSPEVVWVLTPDEENGEGFSLDLNNRKSPKLLCIGNDPTLKDTFSPVVSCVVTVALKLMNQQNKHRSYVFLDEAATLYVPGLEVIPATARSNKVAMVYMTQDLSQMTDAYGKEKMQVMVSNLNNQFFGKVNSLETAKFISELVGREEKKIESTSVGTSQVSASRRNNSTNLSTSYQERSLVRVQDAIGLQQGEFVGQTVETENTFFKGTISRADATQEQFPLHQMVSFGGPHEDPASALSRTVQENFLRVRQEVKETLAKHVNTLAGGTKNDA
ncbi:type IV secretory system conjugative DNA transfer family protein [Siccationidurans ginsengisoli]|nr:type IV secretory system conjugative DNA transfer family protein [Hymenobacter sp. BT559]MBO2033465.1 type IV secretory system conjugative DNA transfer family protein [Hymenobacter sp. BT559]